LRKLITLFFLLTAATSLFAEPERRVVVIRDGNVVVDEGLPLGRRGYVGVSMTNISPELREFFGAPKDAGVLVSSVADNSPADKAGLRVGDVITAVNGKPLTGSWDLFSAMSDKKSGDAIRFEVIRGKAKQTIVATAEERDAPEMFRSFDLGRLEHDLKPLMNLNGGAWRYNVATPDIDSLRARIRELEIRLRELQKRIDK
jgi:membrane-associated protease RseP (regulator of RpoE activity)